MFWGENYKHMSAKVIDNVLALLEQSYPQGIPRQDYFPLLALLTRSLSEGEVIAIAQRVLRGSDSGDESAAASLPEIRAAIHVVTETELTDAEIDRVAARLASVGWPLAEPARP